MLESVGGLGTEGSGVRLGGCESWSEEGDLRDDSRHGRDLSASSHVTAGEHTQERPSTEVKLLIRLTSPRQSLTCMHTTQMGNSTSHVQQQAVGNEPP